MADIKAQENKSDTKSKHNPDVDSKINIDNKINTNNKIENIVKILSKLERVIVAFSGGVDSSVLLKLAIDALGHNNVLAITAIGPMHPAKDIEQAKKIANIIGATHIFCENPAMNKEEFLKNTTLRCYHCKKEVMTLLKKLAKEKNFNAVIAGENADDSSDYRPGHKAIEELGIICPLKDAGLTKSQIRTIAKHLNLPNWNTPANACLVTRIAYNQPLDNDLLKKIDKAEEFIRTLGFKLVRVRTHDRIARIEVLPTELEKLMKQNIREKIVSRLKSLGFLYISADMTGYRTGSLNEAINIKSDKS